MGIGEGVVGLVVISGLGLDVDIGVIGNEGVDQIRTEVGVVVVFEGEMARGASGVRKIGGEDEQDFALAFLHGVCRREGAGGEAELKGVIVDSEREVFENALSVGGLFFRGDEAIGVGVDLGEDLREDCGAGGEANPGGELCFFDEESGVLEVFVEAVGVGLRGGEKNRQGDKETRGQGEWKHRSAGKIHLLPGLRA